MLKTIHFAPGIETIRSERMVDIPVISNRVLHGMPAFVRHEIGRRALVRANRAAGFDLERLEGKNCFIPHAAVVSFVDAAARAAGEANLGILMVPEMNAANYGSYGRYLLGADNLGLAIKRAITALPYHSTDDRMSVAIVGDELRYSYTFALAGCAGYAIIAAAAAGVLLSVCRTYLPTDWRPVRVELDIAKPRQPGIFEDAFDCPVIFNAPEVTIVIGRHHLATSRRTPDSMVTIEDVARDRYGGAPRDLLDVIMEHIVTQVLSGHVSLDSAARSMDTSTRTLQRELNRAGTDFRSLASAARVRRANELLRHTNGSIIQVSAELGYSSPANFARAFRKATGRAPRDFRARG
jgi:AraC-like DNA-binding protein